jgi:hypothetical protein
MPECNGCLIDNQIKIVKIFKTENFLTFLNKKPSKAKLLLKVK